MPRTSKRKTPKRRPSNARDYAKEHLMLPVLSVP
jgi:hypothetical protein